MGILPLTFLPNENAETFGITGEETVSFEMDIENLSLNQKIKIHLSNGKSFDAIGALRT